MYNSISSTKKANIYTRFAEKLMSNMDDKTELKYKQNSHFIPAFATIYGCNIILVDIYNNYDTIYLCR